MFFRAILFFVLLGFSFASGKVTIELTPQLLSYALNQSLQKIDPSLKTKLDLRPQGVLLYHLKLKLEDLRFDSLSDSSRLEELASIRQRLGEAGIIELGFQLGTKLEMKQDKQDILLGLKLFPNTLKITAKGKSEKNFNELLEVLTFFVKRYLPDFLQGVEKKYFQNLEVGRIFTLTAPDLKATQTIVVRVSPGKVNVSNPLVFTSLQTSAAKMVINARAVRTKQ